MPAPTPEQREYAELLLRRATSDLAALRLLLADPEMLDDVIGFHAQQAVEKSIKAVLVLHDADFPRTHDVGELADIARDHGVELPDSVRSALWLTPWAAQMRYDEMSPLDRERANSVADDVVQWATTMFH